MTKIASTTPEEILHMLQDKYKINIYLESNLPHDPGGTNICQLKEYLESYMQMLICFSKTNYQEIYT